MKVYTEEEVQDIVLGAITAERKNCIQIIAMMAVPISGTPYICGPNEWVKSLKNAPVTVPQVILENRGLE